MTSHPSFTVRFVEARDEGEWKRLYSAYRAFYGLAADASVVDRVWTWILRSEHGLRSLVAVTDDGRVVALADVRTFARPSSGSIGLYLDDLFTDPAFRGGGAGGALLDRLSALAADEGASVVRWITDGANTTARRVYDAKATATPWVTYDLAPAASPAPEAPDAASTSSASAPSR